MCKKPTESALLAEFENAIRAAMADGDEDAPKRWAQALLRLARREGVDIFYDMSGDARWDRIMEMRNAPEWPRPVPDEGGG